MADSEFLAFLDDDDELMPNTFMRKIAYFREHPEIDVLVTDGLSVSGSTVTKIFPPPETRCADLVETMMRAGWGACALTLRMQNIDLSVFNTDLRHMEWTLTALELARRYQCGFLDEPTYRYYKDTPNSLSKMAEHNLAGPEVWRRLSKIYADTRYDLSCGGVTELYATTCRGICTPRQHARRVATSCRVIEVSGRCGIRAVHGDTPVRRVAPSVG